MVAISSPVVKLLRAGRLGYLPALRLQKLVRSSILEEGESPTGHTLILVEHEPVYTLGLRESLDPDETSRLISTGAEVVHSDRGGLTTFHGPGQLVAYPIFHLASFRKLPLRSYIAKLELVAVQTCRLLGVAAQLSGKDVSHTGAWANDAKICAIGVHCKRHVTTHGLALNCNVDLAWFQHIVPCGIKDKGVTSLSHELNEDCSPQDAESSLISSFQNIFSCKIQQMGDDEVKNLVNKAIQSPSTYNVIVSQSIYYEASRVSSSGKVILMEF